MRQATAAVEQDAAGRRLFRSALDIGVVVSMVDLDGEAQAFVFFRLQCRCVCTTPLRFFLCPEIGLPLTEFDKENGPRTKNILSTKSKLAIIR
jgi:hypothetical protein